MTDDSDWLKKYQEERAQRVAALPSKGAALCAVLRQHGVKSVEGEYSGSGDSGQIDGISWKPDNLKLPDDVKTAIETLFYDVLEARYAGWENNDGGAGTFKWNVTENAFNHEHITYYTESSSEELEGFGARPL